MSDSAISNLSSADPASTALAVVVVNASTVKTTVDELVGFWSTAAGDMVYAAGARNLARLPIGTSGQLLESTGGIPAWRSKPLKTILGLGGTVNLSSGAATTAISWTAEALDEGGLHSTASNASRVTFGTTGMYDLFAVASVNASAWGVNPLAEFVLNDATILGSFRTYEGAMSAAMTWNTTATTDYVTFRVRAQAAEAASPLIGLASIFTIRGPL